MKHIQLAVILFLALPLTVYILMKSHYIYDKYPHTLTALFFPAKETIWEHSKLFFLPCMLVFFVVSLIVGHNFPNFKASAGFTIVGMSFMPNIFYPIMQKTCNITDDNEIFYSIGLSVVILIVGFIGLYYMTISDKDFTRMQSFALTLVLFVLCLHAITTAVYLKNKQKAGDNLVVEENAS